MTGTPLTLRALLVEDSATDARLVQTLAERSPTVRLQITWVTTVRAAVEKLVAGGIDVVFLDLTLPDSPAEQTVSRIRHDFPGVPVVVWTAMDDPDMAARALKAGAQDYLTKGRLDADLLARTARYAVERQRVRSELEHSYRELDEFAHIISHDLKAPLRAIQNLAQIVKEDLANGKTAKVTENLDRMSDRALRLSKMIDGVLSYSRKARVREPPSDFSVHEVVEEVVEILRPPPTFRVEPAPNLPQLHSDRLRFQEVLQNLIGNAIKHHDSPSGRVRVDVKELEDTYEFFVEDDGPGIPDHEQGRVFDLFHPPSVTTRQDSTHVGLAIVKKIVESMGGRIDVEPVSPRGARFRFSWPKEMSTPAAMVASPPTTRP